MNVLDTEELYHVIADDGYLDDLLQLLDTAAYKLPLEDFDQVAKAREHIELLRATLDYIYHHVPEGEEA